MSLIGEGLANSNMQDQYIKLLKKQISKLEAEDFDLEAWKSSAIAALSRVFGDKDTRADQIDELKIDYSSWALRDSSANYKPIETAKLKGKEILNSAVEEIEIFGAAGNDPLEEYRKMSNAARKKHFTSMKKEELVALLLKLTS